MEPNHKSVIWVNGMKAANEEIKKSFDDFIVQIPDPLPANYPLNETLTYLENLTHELKRADNRVVNFNVVKNGEIEKRPVTLGMVQADRETTDQLYDAWMNKQEVLYDSTLYNTGETICSIITYAIHKGEVPLAETKIMNGGSDALKFVDAIRFFKGFPSELSEEITIPIDPLGALQGHSVAITDDLVTETSNLWTISNETLEYLQFTWKSIPQPRELGEHTWKTSNSSNSNPLTASPLETWEKTFTGTFNGGGYSVQQTNDGGYIITGSGESGVVLIKVDENGNKTWDKTYKGNDACSVQQTTDNGYIITGSSGGDVLLIKTDVNGNEIWDKIFDGSHYDDRGRSVRQTNDGGYIITGSRFGDVLINKDDVLLIKTDENGNEIWNKTFGGSSSDYGYSVQQTTDGGYIIAGITWSHSANIISDAYLIKTDEKGNKLWEKIIGGFFYDEGRSVQQTNDGGYIIAGSTNSYSSAKIAATGWDVWLVKTDDYGNELWNRTFDGPDNNNDEGRSVQQTNDGGYIVAGYIGYSNGTNGVWLIKTDTEGNKLWDRAFDISGTNDPGCSVRQTTDGGYVIVAGYYEIYLIKTDANGNV